METDYRKASNITIIVAGILLFSWFFFKYALGAFIPFLLALAIASILTPISDKLADTLKIPKKPLAAIIVTLFFAILVALAYLAGYRLISEARNLLDHLSQDPEIIGNTIISITEKFSSVTSRFAFLNHLFESEAIKDLGLDINALLSDALNSIITSVSGALPSAVATVIVKIPEFFLFLAVTVIATFYFCADRHTLTRAFSSMLPDKWCAKLPLIRAKISATMRGYFKAYLVIMLMTFCEVFLGLSVLGVNYAFILSMTIAIVDILPVLGAGTVIFPWAIFSLMTSNYKLGIGLLVIYAIISIIRQIAEPKIVGGSLGLHPLATLASIYISIKFIGFAGIFVGPIIALLICNLFKGEAQESTMHEKSSSHSYTKEDAAK